MVALGYSLSEDLSSPPPRLYNSDSDHRISLDIDYFPGHHDFSVILRESME